MVVLTTCPVLLPLPVTVLGPVSVWLGGEPTTAQPGSLSPASVQLMSVPDGRLSVTATPLACGWPRW